MITTKKNKKEKTQQLSIIDGFKTLFSTRNFGREIASKYQKEEVEVSELKKSIILRNKLIHKISSPNNVDLKNMGLNVFSEIKERPINRYIKRIIRRINRIKKLTELSAPEIIIDDEKQLLQKAIDDLNEKYTKYVKLEKLFNKQSKESFNKKQ
ncbi:DNA-directed RNA polymerase subunit beta' [subsurface metagenome]